MHKTKLFNFALPVNLANIFYTVSCLQNRTSLWGLCAMPTGSTSGVEQTLEQTCEGSWMLWLASVELLEPQKHIYFICHLNNEISGNVKKQSCQYKLYHAVSQI